MELSQGSIDGLSKMLIDKLRPKKLLNEVHQKSIPVIEVQKQTSPTQEYSIKDQSDDQLENEVLGYVLSNDTIGARHMLMTKKGMTLNQAVEYISRLETK